MYSMLDIYKKGLLFQYVEHAETETEVKSVWGHTMAEELGFTPEW